MFKPIEVKALKSYRLFIKFSDGAEGEVDLDHPPPHFHAEYGDEKAVFDIRNLIIINGNISSRALGLVVEWASQHQGELLDLWDRASKQQELYKIPPLK